MVGAAGAVVTTVAAGVTAVLRAYSPLVPTALMATTRKVYDVPFVRPGTTTLVAVAPAGVRNSTVVPVVPAKVRTSYPVMAEPPLLAGAVHRTVAEALPAVGAPIVGAP